MARKKEQKESGTISLAEASDGLSERLVKIYKLHANARTGNAMGEYLLKSGIDAGAQLSGIARLATRQAKIEAANAAIIKLNQTSYTADVLMKADIYTAEQVRPLIQYIGHVVNALKELLAGVPETQRVIRIKTPVGVVDTRPAAQPVVVINAASPVTAKLPAKIDETAYTPATVYDDSGFGDPV